MMKIALTDEQRIKRFWDRVNKDGPFHELLNSKCWLWTASTAGGYPQYFAFGETKAHRVSYLINVESIPTGLLVLHKCDNPICVNPNHLFVGTHQDNMDDMVGKNRQASGDRAGPRLHRASRPRGDNHAFRRMPEVVPRGETNGMSKLTESSVRKIRLEYAAGNISHRHLALKYGVAESTVQSIITKKTWRHVK